MNLIDAEVRGRRLDLGKSQLPLPTGLESLVAEGEQVVLGVRPEYLGYSTTPVENSVRGSVTTVENLGVNVLVTLDIGETSMGAVIAEQDEPDHGSTAWLSPVAGRALVYRADSGELIAQDGPNDSNAGKSGADRRDGAGSGR